MTLIHSSEPTFRLAPVFFCTTIVAIGGVLPIVLGQPCPLRTLTGLLCPLCGGTHALVFLGRWELQAAFASNALVTLLGPVLAGLIIAAAVSPSLRADLKRRLDTAGSFWLVVAVLVVWATLRNFL